MAADQPRRPGSGALRRDQPGRGRERERARDHGQRRQHCSRPADRANFSGEMANQLSALAKSGTIRVLDLLFLKKDLDGSVEGFESHEYEDSEVGELRELEAELAMLLAEEDLEAIGATLEPDSYAAVLVFENLWAAPFAAAVRRAGGLLAASGRIPIQALAAALEADVATTPQGA
jgi:hypothetical protein